MSLGLAESYSANAVADVISVFRSKYPDVRFDLFTATADLVLERIDKGLVDIGFLLEPVDVEKYDFVRLEQTERIGILTRADSHLASRGMVTADELVSEPLIVPVRRELRQNFRNIIGTVYDRFNIVATFNVINNASLLVLRGVGSVLDIEGLRSICTTLCSGLFRLPVIRPWVASPYGKSSSPRAGRCRSFWRNLLCSAGIDGA